MTVAFIIPRLTGHLCFGCGWKPRFVIVYDSFLLRQAEHERLLDLDHEFAHFWDQATGNVLSREMANTDVVNWGEPPTGRAEKDSEEDFAESVMLYFNWRTDDGHRHWTDDFGGGLDDAKRINNDPGVGPDSLLLAPDQLQPRKPRSERRPSRDGTIAVYDRFDFVNDKFAEARR